MKSKIPVAATPHIQLVTARKGISPSDAYSTAKACYKGHRWDTGEVAFSPELWAECLRVLKPGGHVMAFGATRTYHRLACAIEEAEFDIRDQLDWLYRSGFPKARHWGPDRRS